MRRIGRTTASLRTPCSFPAAEVAGTPVRLHCFARGSPACHLPDYLGGIVGQYPRTPPVTHDHATPLRIGGDRDNAGQCVGYLRLSLAIPPREVRVRGPVCRSCPSFVFPRGLLPAACSALARATDPCSSGFGDGFPSPGGGLPRAAAPLTAAARARLPGPDPPPPPSGRVTEDRSRPMAASSPGIRFLWRRSSICLS